MGRSFQETLYQARMALLQILPGDRGQHEIAAQVAVLAQIQPLERNPVLLGVNLDRLPFLPRHRAEDLPFPSNLEAGGRVDVRL